MSNPIYGGTTTTPIPFTKTDQTYNPDSENAQSGKAIAAELSSIVFLLNEAKQDKLVSGSNIKSINGQSLLGSGDITIEGGSSETVTVDQTYNPQSDNAQSGKAVAEAISNAVLGESGIVVDQTYSPESSNAQSGKAVTEGMSQVYDLITTEKQGVNLLNPDTFISGMMTPSGELRSMSSLSHTSVPIEVEAGDIIRAYSWNGSNYCAPANIRTVTAYVNGVVDPTLGAGDNTKSYTVPSNVTSIIITAPNAVQLITKNMDTPPTEKVEYTEPSKVPNKGFFVDYEQSKQKIDRISKGMILVTKQYRNMFNPEAVVQGKLNDDGTVDSTNTTFVTSDYIPIVGGQRVGCFHFYNDTYTGGQLNGCCFYNSNKEFIETRNSGMSQFMTCHNETCAYVRISVASYLKNVYNVFVGDIKIDDYSYTPYGTYEEYVSEVKTKKKLAVDGDSITYVVRPSGTGYANLQPCEGYIDEVAHNLDCDLINYAVSASTLAHPPEGGSFSVAPLLDRYHKLPDDADMVYIAIGSNDWSSPSIPLGDFSSTDTNTFYGALKALCEGLKAKYPTTLVMFATPIKRGDKDFELDPQKGQPNGLGEYMVDYRNAILEVCEYYGFPVCDMYAKCGINAWLEYDVTNMIPDKIHPNDKGHHLMAQVCQNALMGYIYHRK